MSDSSAPRKFDHGKPQVNLIPSVALIEMGKVLAFGAQKYDRGNWAKGLATSRYYDAATRHLLAWNAGEDTDPESGLSHLAHAAVNLCFMLWNTTFRKDLDDRWQPSYAPVKEVVTFEDNEPFYAWFYLDEVDALGPVFVNRELAAKCDTQTDGSYATQQASFSICVCDRNGKRRT
jgi:hypothetical protein